MGDRPILTLKKKPAPAPVAAAVPAVPSANAPLSPQQLAKAARVAEAEREYREKAAAIEAARPVFADYFRSLSVVLENRPLTLRAERELTAWLRVQPIALGFTNRMLRLTIEPIVRDHVMSEAYLHALVSEPHRYALDGSVDGVVDEGHKAGAASLLKRIERRAQKQQQEQCA